MQKIRNTAVDCAENDKSYGGLRRKLEILLWIAQTMTNIAVDRAENDKYHWIAQKMKHIAVDRAENDKYCCGSRRK